MTSRGQRGLRPGMVLRRAGGETGPVETVFGGHAKHPYTERLMACVPVLGRPERSIDANSRPAAAGRPAAARLSPRGRAGSSPDRRLPGRREIALARVGPRPTCGALKSPARRSTGLREGGGHDRGQRRSPVRTTGPILGGSADLTRALSSERTRRLTRRAEAPGQAVRRRDLRPARAFAPSASWERAAWLKVDRSAGCWSGCCSRPSSTIRLEAGRRRAEGEEAAGLPPQVQLVFQDPLASSTPARRCARCGGTAPGPGRDGQGPRRAARGGPN